MQEKPEDGRNLVNGQIIDVGGLLVDLCLASFISCVKETASFTTNYLSAEISTGEIQVCKSK